MAIQKGDLESIESLQIPQMWLYKVAGGLKVRSEILGDGFCSRGDYSLSLSLVALPNLAASLRSLFFTRTGRGFLRLA